MFFQGFQYAGAAAGSVPSQPPFYKLIVLIRISTNVLILWHQIYVSSSIFQDETWGWGYRCTLLPLHTEERIRRKEKNSKSSFDPPYSLWNWTYPTPTSVNERVNEYLVLFRVLRVRERKREQVFSFIFLVNVVIPILEWMYIEIFRHRVIYI